MRLHYAYRGDAAGAHLVAAFRAEQRPLGSAAGGRWSGIAATNFGGSFVAASAIQIARTGVSLTCPRRRRCRRQVTAPRTLASTRSFAAELLAREADSRSDPAGGGLRVLPRSTHV